MVKKKRGNSSVRPERAESKEKPYKPRPSKHAQLQAAAAKKPPVKDETVKVDRRQKKDKNVIAVAPLKVERSYAPHAELMTARSEWMRARRPTGVSSYGVCVTTSNAEPFMAHIQIDGQRHVIGTFATPQEAHAAYATEKLRNEP